MGICFAGIFVVLYLLNRFCGLQFFDCCDDEPLEVSDEEYHRRMDALEAKAKAKAKAKNLIFEESQEESTC
jgi:hypothetical protein